MKMIGRKLYLDWGDMILSIEKYPKTDELCEKVHLEGDKQLSLFDIVDICGQKIEMYCGFPANDKFGHEFSYYLTCDSFWATSDEMKKIYKMDILEERKSKQLLENEFDFKCGHKLSESEYKQVYHTGCHVKVLSKDEDESFFGALFRNEDIEAYKNLDEEKEILFVALNMTLCGCICGTVYSAKLNDLYTLRMYTNQ